MYPHHQSPFFKLRSRKRLAEILRVDQRWFKASFDLDSQYIVRAEKEIKSRIIEEPSAKLKKVQRRIKILLGRIEIPDFVQNLGYHRSYATNAKYHINGKAVKSLDIKRFFPNIPSRKVYNFFKSYLECPEDISAILTKLVTYQNHVPTGSPSSSIIAYYAYLEMWNNIESLAKTDGCMLTIYADDITISGPTIPKGLMWKIKNQIHANGLDYHKSKSYEGNVPKEITGVIISNNCLKAPHRQHQKSYMLRQQLKKTCVQKEQENLLRKLEGTDAQIEYISSFSKQ